MDPNDIKALIEAMLASDLAEMEFSENGWSLRLVRGGAPQPGQRPAGVSSVSIPPAPPAFVAEEPTGDVLAPLAGIVHLQPAPDQPPFVAVGQSVEAGATVCIIEAMKVFNAVRAERSGTVEAVLVASDEEVAAGQTLMRIV